MAVDESKQATLIARQAKLVSRLIRERNDAVGAQEALRALQGNYTGMVERYQARRAQVAELEADLEAATRAVGAQQERIKELEGRVAQLTAALGRMTSDRDQVSSIATERGREVADLTSKIDVLQAELAMPSEPTPTELNPLTPKTPRGRTLANALRVIGPDPESWSLVRAIAVDIATLPNRPDEVWRTKYGADEATVKRVRRVLASFMAARPAELIVDEDAVASA